MRTISKYYIPVENNSACNNLKVHLYYDKGGYNYFTVSSEKRGVWLSVSPVNRVEGDGYSSESYTAFSGTKVFLQDFARWSKKVEGYTVSQDKLNALLKHVLTSIGANVEQLTINLL